MPDGVNKQQQEQQLTQYAGVGEPPGVAVGGVGRVAVGLSRVVGTGCKRGGQGEKSKGRETSFLPLNISKWIQRGPTELQIQQEAEAGGCKQRAHKPSFLRGLIS